MLKVFVSYAFTPRRNRWIQDHLITLVQSMGVQVVTGKDLNGAPLGDEITKRIKSCDALIGVITRDRRPSGKLEPSRWVTDEMTVATQAGLRVLEVRELKASDQDGMRAGCSYVPLNARQRVRCLIDVARAITAWGQGVNVPVQVQPLKLVRRIQQAMKDGTSYGCEYVLMNNFLKPIGTHPARIITGSPTGLFVVAPGLPPDSQVQLLINIGANRWRSDIQSVNSVTVKLVESRS